MKAIVKRMSSLVLLGCWAAAIAQTPPEGDPAAGAEAAGQALPCVPAGDALQAPAGESGPLEGQQEVAGEAQVPCEGPVPEAGAGEEQANEEAPGVPTEDAGSDTEEAPEVEVTADEIFTPVDEISEDYPVPLPADI